MRDENSGKKPFRVVDRRFWAREKKGDDNVSDGEETPSKPSYVLQLERDLAEKDSRLQEYITQQNETLNEFENAKERIQREVGKEVERMRHSLLVDFLDILDNLNRALETVEQNQLSPLIEGVLLVRDLFKSKLAEKGVQPIEAIGQRFDPSRHEAISIVQVADSMMDSQVVEVVRDGYTIGDSVLRPAGVVVAQLRAKG
ncbi:MAG: nucleotide exchange factor GrpE [Deltaproteobacteria bacterium]|nr:nucleotide exchange factor GrpE [Deltaproteobacteria bacterium]